VKKFQSAARDFFTGNYILADITLFLTLYFNLHDFS